MGIAAVDECSSHDDSARNFVVSRVLPASIANQVRTGAQLSGDMVVRGALGRGLLPVAPEIASLFPGGALERGRIYCCTGDASLSLLFALIASATQEGSWCALVDMEHAGLQSAREHGVALHRMLCVSSGGARSWPLVVGALVDGVDIVAVSSPTCRVSDARRLAARVKASGAVLVVLGRAGELGADAVLRAHTVSWRFDLHAHARSVEVSTSGRRVHGERRRVVHLPGVRGSLEPADPCVGARQ